MVNSFIEIFLSVLSVIFLKTICSSENSFGANITQNFEFVEISICFFKDLPVKSTLVDIPSFRSLDAHSIARGFNSSFT